MARRPDKCSSIVSVIFCFGSFRKQRHITACDRRYKGTVSQLADRIRSQTVVQDTNRPKAQLERSAVGEWVGSVANTADPPRSRPSFPVVLA